MEIIKFEKQKEKILEVYQGMCGTPSSQPTYHCESHRRRRAGERLGKSNYLKKYWLKTEFGETHDYKTSKKLNMPRHYYQTFERQRQNLEISKREVSYHTREPQ
jgi:hypothetical protein